MFGSKVRREAREQQQNERLRILDEKIRARLQRCLAVADPAERYLAVAGFAQESDARLRRLNGQLNKKADDRRTGILLGATSPLMLLALLEPITFTTVGVFALLSQALVAWGVPYTMVNRSMKDSRMGREKIEREMLPQLQQAQLYTILAQQELSKISGAHLGELALSPKAAEIAKGRPELASMMDAFREAAAKPAAAGEAATPVPAPRQSLTL